MRIAVCDDIKETLDFLCAEVGKQFTEHNIEHVTQAFGNGADFLAVCTKEPFDALFLDIDMPDLSGFEIAERVNKGTVIIFVTDHDELVYSSFKFQPFRFIRKNYTKTELPEAVSALIKVINERTAAQRFELKTSAGAVFVDLNNVEYIEIYGHWLRVCISGGESVECYGSLSDMEKQLAPFSFVRTHKSYLVNCKFIYSIEVKNVVLDDKTEIPLSRYKTEAVKSTFKNYLRSAL